MTPTLSSLIEQVYSPGSMHGTGFSLERWAAPSQVRYYSMGRHAFLAALRIAGVGREDQVLVPDFICREILAPLYSLGAKAIFYRVDREGLASIIRPDTPACKAVLAVNYFGFAQDLGSLRAYCDRTRAILIEDNTHGFLGCDASGQFLGTRCDLGILSLRKILPIPDGAGLLINNPRLFDVAPAQLPSDRATIPFRFFVKTALRRSVNITGVGAMRAALGTFRALRAARTGAKVPPSGIEDEKQLPENARPCRHLQEYLSHLNPVEEVRRRRNLYMLLEKQLSPLGATPIMGSLPSGVSPYCYAFSANPVQALDLLSHLRKLQLDCHLWPQLPTKLEATAPMWQKKIWTAGFLW